MAHYSKQEGLPSKGYKAQLVDLQGRLAISSNG
jgi:hypothetical protein